MATTATGRTTEVAASGPAPAEGAASSSSALGTYHQGLDGLRGVGMVMVLLYHSKIGAVQGAFLALSQFFTLSGFLVTAMLVRSHGRGGIDLKAFWIRRVRRLMPASVVCLLGVAVFGATVATQAQAEDLPGQVAAAFGWVANWYFIVADQSYIDLFSQPSPVHHFWSLSLEEQFYLGMSLFLTFLLARTDRTRTLVVILGSAAVVSAGWTAFLHQSGASLDRIYLGTDTRLSEILLGCVLAVIVVRRPDVVTRYSVSVVGWVGAAAYAASIALWFTIPLSNGAIWDGGMLVYAGLTVLVILGILSGGGPLPHLLGWGPVAAFGRITYGVYLFHWPIFLWLTPERTGLDGWTLFALRVGVTVTAAIASYHLIEIPIRAGRWSSLPTTLRRAVIPLSAVVVIGATVIAAGRDHVDPNETFRVDEDSFVAPVVPDDGVIDVLAISDGTDEELIDAVTEGGLAGDVRAEVVRGSFACSEVVTIGDARSCRTWLEEWPALIDEHNPDVVLLYVDAWPEADIARATGATGDRMVEEAAALLDAGFDQLTTRGANIVWAQPGGSFGDAVIRSLRPFDQAMSRIEPVRADLRHVLGTHLPDPGVVGRDAYLKGAAKAILTDLSLYQRADQDRLPRVMIVGDSQARSLGYGLERWAATEDEAIVWNVAVPGCGVVGAGRTGGGVQPVAESCRSALGAWPDHLASFDPDQVIVLTSVWDLARREVPGGSTVVGIEDEEFRAFLREEFGHVTEVLASTGARVTWMTAPCFDPDSDTSVVPDSITAPTLSRLNEEVIEPVVASRPDASSFDLAGVLCPDGEAVLSVEGPGDLRSDGMHFTAEASQWFAETYGEEILALGR